MQHLLINEFILLSSYSIVFRNLSALNINNMKRVIHIYTSLVYSAIFFKNSTMKLIINNYFFKNFSAFLKSSWFLLFESLSDFTACDMPKRKSRFNLVCNLISYKLNKRLYVTSLTGEWGTVKSLCTVFGCSSWLEREITDMFGVIFSGHFDLRRILTDYGFLGYPLRKEFPVTGFFELRYDDSARRVVAESLNLFQEARVFTLLMSWRKL